MATWSSHGEMRAQRMKPSELRNAFAHAKQLATTRRSSATTRILDFVNASDHTAARVTSTVPVHKPLFEASPAEVWIDEYTPFHPLVLKLSFRNCDTVARRLKIEPPQSPFFRVTPWPAASGGATNTSSKIAAGMDIAFQLEFAPHEVADYAIDLVCVTERERFALPVRVRGKFAALDIPDELAFGRCPVKIATAKVLTVRNVGTRAAKFAFATSPHVRITPPSASLDARGASSSSDSVQLELAMTPLTLHDCSSELTITDDMGQTAVVHLVGEPVNVDVYLSAPLVEPSATYLSLTSRTSVKICNESDHALAFSWRACSDYAHDELERDALLDDLARMESAELEQLALDANDDGDADDDSNNNVVAAPLHTTQSPFDARRAVEHKYKLLRKAAMEDTMQFADDCFALTPLAGRVWPHSEVDVTVCFSPASALLYTSAAFLEIAGRDARLPLQLRGQGIGPRAKIVTHELLDFGDVFISDERTRDFTIQNKGEIPATYELLKPLALPPADMTLDVHPTRATLAVNAMHKVEVTFRSNALGDVATLIQLRLVGSEDILTVRFKATVVPPVVHLDTDALEFGAVAFSFEHTKHLALTSASKITVRFALRIVEDANYRQSEFTLEPATGTLDAFGTQPIRVCFTPRTVKAYDYRLVVSVAGVGPDLLTLPVRAHCHVPDIQLMQRDLDFGTCWLRYPHTQTLELTNTSSVLRGRFTISEQDDHSRAIATYTASAWTGTIEPSDKAVVTISLACEKLGSIRLPLAITIAGSDDLPLAATLTTLAVGPRVELDPHELQFGNCACLIEHTRELKLTNASLIPAPFKTFIRSARSKFHVNVKDGVLAPGASVALAVVATLDDTMVVKDQLVVLVTDGETLSVPLAIKGVGTTIWSPTDLRVIDFRDQMTSVECEWRVTLENKGKRAQVLTWVNRTAAARLKQLDATKASGNSAPSAANRRAGPGKVTAAATSSSKTLKATGTSASDDAAAAIPVFSVFPATIELKPRTACVFVFKGLSSAAGQLHEELACETRVGKDKLNKVAFVTDVCGNFVHPQLAPSASSLAFEYVHHPNANATTEREVAPPKQTQPLRLTNVCPLPLSFTLRTQTPFALDCWEAVLQPSESVDVNVEFYPGFKDDHVCRVLHSKVTIAYLGHPQRDSIELVGDISYPNLSFETTRVDFGCTLNDTQKTLSVGVTNVSKVPTAFRWVLIEDERTARAAATTKRPYIPINQVFDILPIRGKLAPGESERIEFVFYGHANRRFAATVACEVDGGPEYELTLAGEASSLAYRLDKPGLDFGPVLFNKTEDRDVTILNVGKVPFTYVVVTEKLSRSRGRAVDVTPTSGRIAPNDKQKILVRLRPGIPEPFDETLVLEIAHFEPVAFHLVGIGIFAAVSVNLPRENHAASTIDGTPPKWRELKKTARQSLERSTLSAAAVSAAGNSNSNSSVSVGLAASDSRSTISTTQARIADRVSSTASLAPTSPLSKASQRGARASGGGASSPTRLHSTAGGGAAGNSSSSTGSLLIDDVDVETEACRLFFASYLLAQESKKAAETRASALTTTNDEVLPQQQDADDEQRRSAATDVPTKSTSQRPENSSSSTATTKALTVTATKKRNSANAADSSFPFVLSSFVLDFGIVVLGAHRVRKFTITNIGVTPASFQLDKNAALARGFTLEPERVVRLPEKHAVEFSVTFQARKQIALGKHETTLAVAMKNGPPSLVTLRALVTVPDIALALETLDFGKTAVSTCHTLCTQLHNPSAVAAEWAVKKPMGSAKDVSYFRVTPSSGVLAPGFRTNVHVEFVPDESRLYALKLPIHVAANPKTRSLTCRGEGSELRLSFEPPMLELGPVLPTAVVTRNVTMHNDSDYAVEVFALDFDNEFEADDALLRHVVSTASTAVDGVAHLPPRAPGQPLRAYLLEHGLVAAESAIDPSLLEATAADPTSSSTGSLHAGSDGRNVETTAAAMTESASKASLPGSESLQQHDGESESVDTNRDVTTAAAAAAATLQPRKGLDYVVLGPPRCGKSTQAQLLAEKENLCVWTIDDAVRRICLEPMPLGDATRRALGLMPVSAKGDTDADTPPDDPSANSSSSSTSALNSVAGAESPETDELQQQHNEANLADVTPPQRSIAPLLDSILRWRVTQSDLVRGGVLDGFANSFVPLDVVVTACASAFATARVIVLSFDDDSYDAMATAMLKNEEARRRKSMVAIPSVASSELLLTDDSMQATADVGATLTEQQQQQSLGDAPVSNADEQQQLELAAEPDDVDDSAFSASTLVELNEQFDRVLAAQAATTQQQRQPQMFSEYASSFDAMRRLVQCRLLMRDNAVLESNSASSLPATSEQPTDKTSSAALTPVAKGWMMRPDSFWLDVPIAEPPGAALFVHNVVYAAIERCVRELESSNLAIPPAATYQVVRRPTERFPRKPVTRFQLFASPTASLDTVTSNNQQDDDISEGADAAEAAPSDHNASTTRWLVPARGSVDLVVEFASPDVGAFDVSLGFEIVGVRREFALLSRGVCTVPSINTDPRNVFMSRIKSRPDAAFVHKKFVLSKSQFEFGPLLVLAGTTSPSSTTTTTVTPPMLLTPPASDADVAQWIKTRPMNVESIRISNASAFPLRVDFCFEKNGIGVFATYPLFLELADGETKDVKLWASPPTDGLHENSLVCCVSDNPEPVVFAVTCFGCTPTLVLHGPWEQPAASSTSETNDTTPSDAVATTALSADTAATTAPVPVLDFEQLLLERTDEKSFVLENVTPIAVAWRLRVQQDVPSDIQLSPTDGVLKPMQQMTVAAVFTATTEAIYKLDVVIEFSDAESALQDDARVRSLPLVIAAEAYKIDVRAFDSSDSNLGATSTSSSSSGDGSLDFGLVRVGERHTRSFPICNRGKYDIKFVVKIRSATARALFTVDPTERVLEPGATANVSVTFVAASKEVTLRDCRGIKCTLIEMLSGAVCREFIVLTTVRSVYSVYRVQPTRGINFGPLKYTDAVRTKRLEIRNDGAFAFKYRVRPAATGTVVDPLTLETALHPSTLTLGQFSLSPDSGTIDPGVVAGVDVTFAPIDCRIFRELLCVEISGANPHALVDATTAIDSLQQYELVGESCFPGINTSDYESIFEEQIVVRSIGLGSTAEASASAATAAVGNNSLLCSQSVVFAEQEQLFSFGALVAATAANAKGCVERFKITNPTKVSTTVQFQITSSHQSPPAAPVVSSGNSRSSSSADLLTATPAVQAFTVQPAVWEIPPLEHRFVSVYFKPTTIASYHARFIARVDDSSTPAVTPTPTSATAVTIDSTQLAFALRGEGTMPCISVVEPTLRDAAAGGALLLPFDRVRVSKSKDLRLVLRNDGILPATILFALQANPNFVFALASGSLTLVPGATEVLSVSFKPQRVHDEPTVSTLRITVHSNPFDETTIKLVGSGFREDVVFDDLPLGHDDELHFDDVELVAPASPAGATGVEGKSETPPAIPTDVKVFSLCNHAAETVRFAWPTAASPFTFSPATGHVGPRAYKLIRATFTPAAGAAATVWNAHVVALQTQCIKLNDAKATENGDWDDSAHTTVSFDAGTTAAAAQREPAFEALGAASSVRLQCFAAADALAFECDTTAIHFKRTFMLQACSHRMTLRNTSKITLQFTWRLEHAAADNDSNTFAVSTIDDDDECPFEISPTTGTIAAETAQVFIVKFAPMEVDEHYYVLVLHATAATASANDRDSFGDAENTSHTLRIDVRGASLRPACHFDVEPSDYAQRRAPQLRGPHGELGPLDASVKVLELTSLGVRVRNTKRFYVVNPTNVSYEFSWTPEPSTSTPTAASSTSTNPCFRCATPKGLMLAGKRCEMSFEFTPQTLAVEEMFWRFAVPHFDVSQLFLLVGSTTEPRVLLDRGSVNFNTLLIGTKATQTVTLVNHEHVPFPFVFDRASLDFGNEPPALLVHPLSGVVPPHGRTNVDVEFVPTDEKVYNLNLSCLVKRKPTRLSLNVKGEGYRIHDALTIQPTTSATAATNESERAIVLGPLGSNVLDFGAVRVHETLERTIVIHNRGKFNFEFVWSTVSASSSTTSTTNKPLLPPALTIEPMYGTVKKTDKVACRLVFAPTTPVSLAPTQLTCTIAGARTYVLALAGHAVPPSLQLSFVSHDFGACFVSAPHALPRAETVVLTIVNMDATASVDVDCAFEHKPHLRVECAPTVLAPRATLSVPIVFTARDEIAYADVVPFTINGSSTISVSVRGEGIKPIVELVNAAAMQRVAFSASLAIGQQLVRTVKIVNRAKRAITVELVDEDDNDDAVVNDSDNMAAAAARRPSRVPSLAMLGLSIVSPLTMTLRPKETADVAFQFAPTRRIPSFERDVFLRVAGATKKLVTLAGCCQGIDVSLDTDVLSFGTVCLGSQLVRTVRLQNRGDIAAKFQWMPADFAPDFVVAPVDGVVASNGYRTIEVTFTPAAVNPDVRYDRVACQLETSGGGNSSNTSSNTAPSLPVFLTLVGGCVQQATSSIQELSFSSRVREATTKTIVIENKTSAPWLLFPVVTGAHWSCPESVAVPADGKASVDIVYCPLRMTQQSSSNSNTANESETTTPPNRPERLEGSIFFAIPDGTALLYNVVGKASAPAPAAALSLSTPAKKTLAVVVPLTNWLSVAQMFDVTITNVGSLASESVVAQGPPSVTVAGGATRQYNLKVFSYIEGTVELRVQFLNAATSEYVDVDVRVSVTKAAEVETLHLDAPVRQTLTKLVTIENPFDASHVVRFADPERWWHCTSAAVRVRQLAPLTGRPDGSFEIAYRPTLFTEVPVDATLTIVFAELGEFRYKLVLATQRARVEQTLHFHVPLGSAQTQRFAFTTFVNKPAELLCSVGQPTSFAVPSTLAIQPASDGMDPWLGSAAVVDVTFEPEAIGDVRDVLTLVSDTVGEYKCALVGVSVPPVPQGPFVVSAATGARDIAFRNVFSVAMDFDVVIDNLRFSASVQTLSLPPKTSKVVSVRVVDPTAGGAGAGTGTGTGTGAEASDSDATMRTSGPGSNTGKLFITSATHRELPPWVYYLEAALT